MCKDSFVAVSGGLDPLHAAHLKMINEAAEHGRVIVILNSDEWLMRKKGYIFMKYEDRKYILENLKNVDHVVSVNDADGTVCEALKRIKPDFFANGGDRKDENTPEVALCQSLGIKMLWNIGGGKENSSSELVKSAAKVLKERGDI